MDLLETIRQRRSARGFLNIQVDSVILEDVLRDACNAPSAINIQPWEVTVVTGNEINRLSKRLLKRLAERKVTCGPGSSKEIPARFINRAKDTADGMTPLVEEMQMDFKTFVNEGSLQFYGAPAVVFIYLDESFPPDRMVDIGIFIGYFVLASAGHGLSTCPIGLVTWYEDEIKDVLNIPETKKLVISLAVGYRDEKSPINAFRSDRVDTKEFVRWFNS